MGSAGTQPIETRGAKSGKPRKSSGELPVRSGGIYGVLPTTSWVQSKRGVRRGGERTEGGGLDGGCTLMVELGGECNVLENQCLGG